MQSVDTQIRIKAFEWLQEQVAVHGDVLPRQLLANGFEFESEKIPLVSPQGIFKPKQLSIPLSLTTTPKGPYDDNMSKDGFLQYKYRGTDPNHPDNVGLRTAFEKGIALIYFHGIVPGRYLAIWPVYIIADDPANLTFKAAVDDSSFIIKSANMISEDSTSRRAYLTSTVKSRVHQRSFRERVLAAYQSQCSLCRLKHIELLDAAHIIPDKDPKGIPMVENGIALCKLHHAAFDSFIIGISPDYVINVRPDVLHEIDGPMLKHGLIELHNSRILLPKQENLRPNREYLDIRFHKFQKAS